MKILAVVPILVFICFLIQPVLAEPVIVTKILNRTNGGIIGDVSVHEASPQYTWMNFGGAPDIDIASIFSGGTYINNKRDLIKISKSLIPKNAEILEVNISLFGGEFIGNRNYSAYHITSNWCEGNGPASGCIITEEECGCEDSPYKAATWGGLEEITILSLQDTVNTGHGGAYRLNWDITPAFKQIYYYSSEAELSIMIMDTHENDTTGNYISDITSTENEAEWARPIVTVKYIDNNYEPPLCPTDVKQCPDGSYVGRNPNNYCEFYPCPTSEIKSDYWPLFLLIGLLIIHEISKNKKVKLW